MKDRLCFQTEAHRGLHRSRRLSPDLHPAETQQPLHQGRTVDENSVSSHFFAQFRLFHLRICLFVKKGLGGKSLGIYAICHITHEKQIFHHHHRAGRQKVRKRDLVLQRSPQLGHYDSLLQPVARKLRLHVEYTDTVHLIAEKVHTARLLRRIRKNIENTAAHGKLPRFVHIIHP